MPDAARIAQAHALEVPLILQGAKTVEGTDRRELFKEEATTTLVFENGAVLNLRCKLAVGQTVFIHNTQNGREILCKVVEAPHEGEPGFTDLEFSTADPEFWNADAARSQPVAQNPSAAAEKPETNRQPEAPAEDSLAMMSETASNIHLPNMVKPGQEAERPLPLREELVPAHEMVPNSSAAPTVDVPSFEPAATTESHPTEPTGEQIDAALKQMSGAAHAASSPDGAEPEHADDQKHLSALMERDARLAKFAAFKEKQAEKLQRDAAAKGAAKGPSAGALEAESAIETEDVRAKVPLSEKLMTGKNATYVTIGAAVVIVVLLGFIWNAMRGVFIHPSDAPVASVTPQPKPATPDALPAIAAAIPPANTASAKPPQPIVVPTPKATLAPRAHAEIRTSPSRREAAAVSDVAASSGQSLGGSSAGEIIPARVVSQPQPTLPPWAKDMEVDGVVTMDVTINESGNVTETKVLSGPRALQHEAERALSLWEFVPGRSGGKATSSHITLSVQFLPPAPPKRPWE